MNSYQLARRIRDMKMRSLKSSAPDPTSPKVKKNNLPRKIVKAAPLVKKEQQRAVGNLPRVVKRKEKKMTELSIPTLDLEDLDFDEIEEVDDGVKDEAGGALVYGVIGSGQAGGRIAKAFYDIGYKKTVAFNTAKHDLATLDIPDKNKFFIDHLGDQGAGKNQEKSKAAFEERNQEVFNKLRDVMGSDVDRILICVGVAGGTGGGSAEALVESAKKYLTYIGADDVATKVGVIASLPTNGECASEKVASNAYSCITKLCKSAKTGTFAPLIIVDNDKINKLYPRLTVKKFWPTLNNTIAGLFHIFNVLAGTDSAYTSFDPADYKTVMSSKGCMILGLTSVKSIEDETSIATVLKKNLERTLLAGEFNLATATIAASLVVGGTVMYEEVEGLMGGIEYSFDTLATLTNGATIHRGIYEDANREKLCVYTMIAGLDDPTKRIKALKRFFAKS
tara:strand:- start:33306 stop:34655 length:1350 start_codon:yes stop_codon:yes gene_type:complete